MRYWFETCPNPDVAVLHADERFPKASALCGSLDTWPEPDPAGAALIESLLAIDGIVSASMGQYRCQVEKARLFSWQDLWPRIVEMFGARYGEMVESCPELSEAARRMLEVPLPWTTGDDRR